jgi:hypothetical protein
MKRLMPLLLLALAAAGYGAATPPAAAFAETVSVSPASSLTVIIGGPRRIGSQYWCTWEANVSGGTAPYSYSWSTVNGGGTGYDELWGGHFSLSGTLTVQVTDALGATGSSTINVTSVWNGPACP